LEDLFVLTPVVLNSNFHFMLATTRKHTMVGQNYFKGEEQTHVWGDKNK